MGKIANLFNEQKISLPIEQRKQMLALDREFDELESKVTTLNSECLHLRAQVEPLKKQVERLQHQLEKQGTGDHDLEQNEIEMMKFIGNKQGTSKDIREGMNLHPVTAEHYLGKLLKAGYLEQSQVPMVGAWYALTDKGNAYLVKKNLVPVPGTQIERPDNPKGHRCDHCGSAMLKRTGSRPDPTFGELGVKQAVYMCLSCRKESAFTDDK